MALKRTAIRCPHCNEPARVSTSTQLSPLVRESYYDCTDVIECGHRFVVTSSIERTVVRSLKERDDIQLPVVKRHPDDIIVARKQAATDPTSAPESAPIETAQRGALMLSSEPARCTH